VFAPRDPDDYILGTERRVIKVRRHWSVLLGDTLEGAALLVGLMMISYLLPENAGIVQNVLWYVGLFVVLRLAYFVIEWWVERIVVTDKRFMIASGVFDSKLAMMPVTKVTDLTYERTVLGRMFGFGTLVVESAGQIQALNRIEFLPYPEEVYDAISELVFGDKKAQADRFSMIKAQRIARGKKMVP
jgi:uncharacterized membrane protein YdbT with pleckstrin-like domain